MTDDPARPRSDGLSSERPWPQINPDVWEALVAERNAIWAELADHKDLDPHRAIWWRKHAEAAEAKLAQLKLLRDAYAESSRQEQRRAVQAEDAARAAETKLAQVRELCDDAEQNMTPLQKSLPTCYVNIPSNHLRAVLDAPLPEPAEDCRCDFIHPMRVDNCPVHGPQRDALPEEKP